jgi:hypothetical protein
VDELVARAVSVGVLAALGDLLVLVVEELDRRATRLGEGVAREESRGDARDGSGERATRHDG